MVYGKRKTPPFGRVIPIVLKASDTFKFCVRNRTISADKKTILK